MEQMEQGTMELGNGSLKARLTGIDTKAVLLGILMVLAVGIFAVIVQDTRRIDEEARKGFSLQHKVTQDLLSVVIKNQSELITLVKDSQQITKDGSGEITYMLTLDQTSRERLRLQMPQSLRQKVGPR